MIADQLRNVQGIFDAIRKLEIDRFVQRDNPIRRLTGQTHMRRQQFFRSPVDDDMQIDPAESRNHHLGHIDSPIPVRLNRPRLVRNGLARRFEVMVFRNEQIELSHKAVYPFPVDRTLFMVLEIRPNTTIPTIWVLRL